MNKYTLITAMLLTFANWHNEFSNYAEQQEDYFNKKISKPFSRIPQNPIATYNVYSCDTILDTQMKSRLEEINLNQHSETHYEFIFENSKVTGLEMYFFYNGKPNKLDSLRAEFIVLGDKSTLDSLAKDANARYKKRRYFGDDLFVKIKPV